MPFAFFLKIRRRERAWLIGLSAMYLCLGVLLIVLLNPTPDRASADLIKVFLVSSHTMVACLIGYGLALTAAFMAARYDQFRLWGIAGGIIATVLGLYCLLDATGHFFFGPAGQIGLSALPQWVLRAFSGSQFGLPVLGNLVLVAIGLCFVCSLVISRQRSPLALTLCLFTAMPLYSALSHWQNSEQRGHWFGYWFGHDMFKPPFKAKDNHPLYAPMAKDAILFGGTDPGRFCPTYMNFCESFLPHDCQPAQDQHFDRRDVYIITQNALADGTYLDYLRAQYNRSKQIDPPFFTDFFRTILGDKPGETNFLARSVAPLDRFFTALGARIEKQRRTYTSWFNSGSFTNLSALVSQLRPGPDQTRLSKWLYQHLSPQTQSLLSSGNDQTDLRRDLAQDLNLLLQQRLFEPALFSGVSLSSHLRDFLAQDPQGDTRVRLNRLLLEAAYPASILHSNSGLYPDTEIYIPTDDDLGRCFQEYRADALSRYQHDQRFPNQPPLIKPGENVTITGNQFQVTGIDAVFGIDALMAKIIFDRNPKHEFYVEESYPLDWMYPYLTPYGIIMKVNRHPLLKIDDAILERDHEFWKEYSKRLTGDVIHYDTSIQQLTAWVEKVYVHHDLSGFTGDTKFLRDSDAQKSFSKLRSAVGGIYAWRIGPYCPPEYRPKSEVEYQHLLREAEFAYGQAFALCPYSPDALYRYAKLLTQINRLDDALLLTKTCLKLDPYNKQFRNVEERLKAMKGQTSSLDQLEADMPRLEATLRTNPADFGAAFKVASVYLAQQKTNRAVEVLDNILNQTNAGPRVVLSVANAFAQIQDLPGLESSLQKLVKVAPADAEAWYDLAAISCLRAKPTQALDALKRALELSDRRLQANPKAFDLRAEARSDSRFASLRSLPEFQKLVRSQ